MTQLIAMLSSGQGTWVHVAGLIKSKNFEHSILVTNEFGVKKFPEMFPELNSESTKYEFVVVDLEKSAKELIRDISGQLGMKRGLFEVGLNFVSGSGKEHMCLVAALLKQGIGFRLVALTKEGLEEL